MVCGLVAGPSSAVPPLSTASELQAIIYCEHPTPSTMVWWCISLSAFHTPPQLAFKFVKSCLQIAIPQSIYLHLVLSHLLLEPLLQLLSLLPLLLPADPLTYLSSPASTYVATAYCCKYGE